MGGALENLLKVVSKMIVHNVKMQPFLSCDRLKEAGKDKIIEWFRTELFVDIHRDSVLPPKTGPSGMLKHLPETHDRPGHCWQLMAQVEKMHNTA